ncbi:hypothetical protein JCM6882_006761 [Rhodosporidiobolus microsporus]
MPALVQHLFPPSDQSSLNSPRPSSSTHSKQLERRQAESPSSGALRLLSLPEQLVHRSAHLSPRVEQHEHEQHERRSSEQFEQWGRDSRPHQLVRAARGDDVHDERADVVFLLHLLLCRTNFHHRASFINILLLQLNAATVELIKLERNILEYIPILLLFSLLFHARTHTDLVPLLLRRIAIVYERVIQLIIKPQPTSQPDQDDETSTSDTQVFTRTSTSLFSLTTSGTVVVVTSVVTALVTGDPSATAGAGGRSLNGSSGSNNSFFDNTGAVAGTFVVVGLVAAGIIIGLAWFFLRRKRARKLDEDIRVAAGGAGDGGAGINRFDDEEDEEDDPFGRMSDGHGSNYMSSYGTVPLAAAAAGFGQHRPNSGYDYSGGGTPNGSHGGGNGANGGNGGGGRPSFEPGHSPAQSQGSIPPYHLPQSMSQYGAPATLGGAAGGVGGGVAGYNGYGTGMSGARSHEGMLHDDWAEFVHDSGAAGAGAGAAGGGGAAVGAAMMHRGSGSGEGEMGSQEGMVGSGASHSAHGHPSPNMRDSVESYYPSDAEKQDVAAFRNSLYGAAAFDNLAAANGGSNGGGSANGHGGGGATDDRLDPGAIGAGGGNISAISLADEQDYSRRILRVANPSD